MLCDFSTSSAQELKFVHAVHRNFIFPEINPNKEAVLSPRVSLKAGQTPSDRIARELRAKIFVYSPRNFKRPHNFKLNVAQIARQIHQKL